MSLLETTTPQPADGRAADSGLRCARPCAARTRTTRIGNLNRVHSSARHSHGAGDGAGIAVCRGGRVLGGPAGRQCGGHGGHHRVDAGAGVRHRPGRFAVDHGDGGAAHRRKRPGRRGHRRRAGHRAGTGDFAGAGHSGGDLCAATAAADGRFAGHRGHGLRLRAHRAGRMRRHHHAVSEQRHLSRRGRCGHCHAPAVGVEHHQPHPRSVPDFRPLGSVPAHGRDRRGAGHVYRPQHRRALPVLPADAGHGAHSRARASSAAECRA